MKVVVRVRTGPMVRDLLLRRDGCERGRREAILEQTGF